MTGNPQITWFKLVYRRYTNFAIESQAMYFDGDPNFGKRLTCLVPRRGDLLGPTFLEIALPQLTRTDPVTGVKTNVDYCNNIGMALIEEISIEIGEQEIDKQTGEWMFMYSKLTTEASKKDAFDNMVGNSDSGILPTSAAADPCSTGGSTTGTIVIPDKTKLKLYIPLQFWFCKNPGLYLPLLAMQYHPIRINVKLRPLEQLYNVVPPLSATGCGVNPVDPARILDIKLWGDFVYLDTEERRRFVANSHEYLIEQVQYTPPQAVTADVNDTTVRLEFNHPIRELYWRIQRDFMKTTNEWMNFTSKSKTEAGYTVDMLQSATVQVDGFDRFDTRDAGYFRLVQPYQYHTAVPIGVFIYSYSFALRPEEMQPSGSLNASRIDNMNLKLSLTVLKGNDYWVKSKDSAATALVRYDDPNATGSGKFDANQSPSRGNANIVVYAKNHNVLRVVNGFAGLLFKI